MGGSARVSEIKKLQNISSAKICLRKLKEGKFIKARKIGKKLIIELTDKGVAATLSEQLRQETLLPSGTYTLVIFDIPETEREARRHFRWLLRQGEFIKLQQSVWISKHNVQNTITQFVKKLKLEKWVNVGLVSNLFTVAKNNL
jgi:DNA-binding transcriptional regulator PaaX